MSSKTTSLWIISRPHVTSEGSAQVKLSWQRSASRYLTWERSARRQLLYHCNLGENCSKWINKFLSIIARYKFFHGWWSSKNYSFSKKQSLIYIRAFFFLFLFLTGAILACWAMKNASCKQYVLCFWSIHLFLTLASGLCKFLLLESLCDQIANIIQKLAKSCPFSSVRSLNHPEMVLVPSDVCNWWKRT